MSLPGMLIRFGFDIRDGNLVILDEAKGIVSGGRVVAGGPAASGISNPTVTGVAVNSSDVSGVNTQLGTVNTNIANITTALNSVLAVLRNRGFIQS